MDIPKFSVCMSVYINDNPVFLSAAIHSIYKQSVPPSEIILIQDGPVREGVTQEIESLKKKIPILKVSKLEKNIGHAGARQKAMEMASYPLIAVMDADDLSVYNRFESQLAIFQKFPEVAVVGGLIKEFVDTPSNIVGERVVPESDKEIKTYLKSRCPMNLVTVMYRKMDIEAVGGFVDWYCEEDYYLWIRLALKGYQFYNIQDNLVNVRVGKEMYQRRGGLKYFKSEAKLQAFMLKNDLISFPRYFVNICIRFVVQVVMPNKIRGFLFQKLFRK